MRRLRIVGATAGLLVLAGCGSTTTTAPPTSAPGITVSTAAPGGATTDYSSKITQAIIAAGAAQLFQQNAVTLPSGSATIVPGINYTYCIQVGATYPCQAQVNVTDAGTTSIYLVEITATCDASGSCQWHVNPGGITRVQ